MHGTPVFGSIRPVGPGVKINKKRLGGHIRPNFIPFAFLVEVLGPETENQRASVNLDIQIILEPVLLHPSEGFPRGTPPLILGYYAKFDKVFDALILIHNRVCKPSLGLFSKRVSISQQSGRQYSYASATW
jgi:hypothetical protein